VVGWGSLNSFNPRPAYDHVADFLRVRRARWRGKGVGRVLLDALVVKARALGYHKLVLAAFPFNEAGTALYEKTASGRSACTRSRAGWTAAGWTSSMMEKLL
jgi:phosphinothricin acetyltransferase